MSIIPLCFWFGEPSGPLEPRCMLVVTFFPKGFGEAPALASREGGFGTKTQVPFCVGHVGAAISQVQDVFTPTLQGFFTLPSPGCCSFHFRLYKVMLMSPDWPSFRARVFASIRVEAPASVSLNH